MISRPGGSRGKTSQNIVDLIRGDEVLPPNISKMVTVKRSLVEARPSSSIHMEDIVTPSGYSVTSRCAVRTSKCGLKILGSPVEKYSKMDLRQRVVEATVQLMKEERSTALN